MRSPSVPPRFKVILKCNGLDLNIKAVSQLCLTCKKKEKKRRQMATGKPGAIAFHKKKIKKSPLGYSMLFEEKSRDMRIKYTSLLMNAA